MMLFASRSESPHQLATWGYSDKTVNHAQAEDARDEEGDGLGEVHLG
jgi:hypothetical protein